MDRWICVPVVVSMWRTNSQNHKSDSNMIKQLITGVTLGVLTLAFAGCAMNKSLHLPAGQGDLAKVRAEIEGGTNVNARDIAGQTALMYAAETGRLHVVEYLIENGADLDATSGRGGRGTALIYASAANQIKVMECLLSGGADINATSANHETPLFWAAAMGHIPAVELLLKNKADTAVRNNGGETALQSAKTVHKTADRTEVMRLLSEKQ
jgi:ankyrin repeat protein